GLRARDALTALARDPVAVAVEVGAVGVVTELDVGEPGVARLVAVAEELDRCTRRGGRAPGEQREARGDDCRGGNAPDQCTVHVHLPHRTARRPARARVLPLPAPHARANPEPRPLDKNQWSNRLQARTVCPAVPPLAAGTDALGPLTA